MSEGIYRYPSNIAAMPTGAMRKQAELNRENEIHQNAKQYCYLCQRMVRAWDGENTGLQRAIVDEMRALIAETGGAA